MVYCICDEFEKRITILARQYDCGKEQKMQASNLQLYSIMGLNTDYVDEICEDIRDQYKNGIMTCALFSMTLTPEGDPPVDKAGAMCQKYDIFRLRL